MGIGDDMVVKEERAHCAYTKHLNMCQGINGTTERNLWGMGLH